MNWFLNLKIRTKLLLSFTLVALFILAAGLYSTIQITKVNSNLKNIYNNDLQSVKLLGQLKANELNIRADILQVTVKAEDTCTAIESRAKIRHHSRWRGAA